MLIHQYIIFVTDTNDFSVPNVVIQPGIFPVTNVVIPQGGIPVTMCAPVMATQDELAEGNHGFSINIASTSLASSVTVITPDTTSVDGITR